MFNTLSNMLHTVTELSHYINSNRYVTSSKKHSINNLLVTALSQHLPVLVPVIALLHRRTDETWTKADVVTYNTTSSDILKEELKNQNIKIDYHRFYLLKDVTKLSQVEGE